MYQQNIIFHQIQKIFSRNQKLCNVVNSISFICFFTTARIHDTCLLESNGFLLLFGQSSLFVV